MSSRNARETQITFTIVQLLLVLYLFIKISRWLDSSMDDKKIELELFPSPKSEPLLVQEISDVSREASAFARGDKANAETTGMDLRFFKTFIRIILYYQSLYYQITATCSMPPPPALNSGCQIFAKGPLLL